MLRNKTDDIQLRSGVTFSPKLTLTYSNVAPKIDTANDFGFYHDQFNNTEETAIIFLFDADHLPLGHVCGTSGSRHIVDVSIRDLVQLALDTGSWSMLVVHNHPSNDPTPSQADIVKTRTILKALQPLKIILHDHIIYTESRQFSFKSHGLI